MKDERNYTIALPNIFNIKFLEKKENSKKILSEEQIERIKKFILCLKILV